MAFEERITPRCDLCGCAARGEFENLYFLNYQLAHVWCIGAGWYVDANNLLCHLCRETDGAIVALQSRADVGQEL